MSLVQRLFFRLFICFVKREAAEGESKNTAEAKKRVAENESSANSAEAAYRAEAHVNVSMLSESRDAQA